MSLVWEFPTLKIEKKRYFEAYKYFDVSRLQTPHHESARSYPRRGITRSLQSKRSRARAKQLTGSKDFRKNFHGTTRGKPEDNYRAEILDESGRTPRTDPSNSKSRSWIEKLKKKKSKERRNNDWQDDSTTYNVLHTNVYYDDRETGVKQRRIQKERKMNPEQMRGHHRLQRPETDSQRAAKDVELRGKGRRKVGIIS